MMEHFAIDLLSEYRTEEIPDTKRPVVNPRWRDLDCQKQSIKSKLNDRRARFAALTMHPESDESAQAKWEKRKAELVEEIQQLEHQLTEVEIQMKATPIIWSGRNCRSPINSGGWHRAESNWSIPSR